MTIIFRHGPNLSYFLQTTSWARLTQRVSHVYATNRFLKSCRLNTVPMREKFSDPGVHEIPQKWRRFVKVKF